MQLGYGLFILATTLVAWIEWSINSIFSRTTVKFIGETEDWQSVGTTVMRVQLAISSVAALLLIAASPVIAMVLNESTLATYLAKTEWMVRCRKSATRFGIFVLLLNNLLLERE